MNIALIIAGGSGIRMGQDIPKQFINVYNKPVLLYTLEGFQKHPLIDAIEVVCLEGWQDVLQVYAKQYNISKLKWIVLGGNSAQESIRNGVYNLENKCNEDDIVIIHDGIRPLVEEWVLTDVIVKCQKYGNAVASLPYNEQIFVIDDEIRAILQKNYDRAKSILETNMDILHAMKDALLKYETIDSEQIDDLMARRPVREPDGYNTSKSADSGNDDQDKPQNPESGNGGDAPKAEPAREQQQDGAQNKPSKPSQDSF